jgi:hypothetical protein
VNGVCQDQIPTQAPARRSSAPSVAIACVALYLAAVLTLFLVIRHRDDGVFTYTLDDPYIHLALAQSLAHGHYGINPGEPSSPSSSIVWPFLLVPFATHPWNLHLPLLYAPLAWNVIFCAIAAWLIGRTVERLTWRPRAATRFDWLGRLAIAAALMLIANLAGLTFVGMEHGLQVLLAIACAAGLVEAFAGRPIPAWSLAAAVLGPSVRYENFALVAAVVIALYGQRRYRTSALVAGLSLVGPAIFSLFLISRGLPALPSSILVKAMVYSFHRSFLVTAIATMIRSMYWGVREVAWWEQLLIALLLLYLTFREKRRPQRFILGGVLFAAILQLTIGRFNWFNRYEVYAFIFTVTIACAALIETTALRRGILIACLLAFGTLYAIGLYDTPAAAASVYQQQYQTHRFIANFKGRAVAVNDLGLVSYDRPVGLYILDLWGLASPEASRRVQKDAAWLDAITRTHSADLVVIYPDWYPDGAPGDWRPLATMCITARLVSVARRCVVFYSTPTGDHAALQAQLAAFARTLPPTVKITLGKDSTELDDDP